MNFIQNLAPVKKTNSLNADHPPSRDLQSARDRMALAEASAETAAQQSLAARQRRKEAKEEARRAKKRLRQAKRELKEARDVLNKAEETDAIEGERRRAAASVKRRAAIPRPPTKLRPIRAKKAARKRARSPKRPSPVVTPGDEETAASDFAPSVGGPIAAERRQASTEEA